MALGWPGFTGENPLLFTHSLLSKLQEYESNANRQGITAGELRDSEYAHDIRRQIGLGFSPDRDPNSPLAVGTRLHADAPNYLYPGHSSESHRFEQPIPPIRTREGVLIVGKADDILLGANGLPELVHDWKYSFMPEEGRKRFDAGLMRPVPWTQEDWLRKGSKRLPDSFESRIIKNKDSTQALYASALGLNAITYKGFAMPTASEHVSIRDELARAEAQGLAPSMGTLRNWTDRGIDTLSRMGRNEGQDYLAQFAKNSLPRFDKLFLPGMDFAREMRIPNLGFNDITAAEHRLYYQGDSAERQAVSIPQLEEEQRRDDGGRRKKVFSGFSVGHIQDLNKGVHTLDLSPYGAGHDRTIAGMMSDTPYGPQQTSFRKWLGHVERGEEDQALAQSKIWSNPDADWSQELLLLQGEYRDKQKAKVQGSFESARDRASFSARMSGKDEDAAVYEATTSMQGLQESLISVAKAGREATIASREQAAETSRIKKGLGAMGSIEPYDWTKWHKARGEAIGNIQGASSWLPGFLTRPFGRFSNAAFQSEGADVAVKKGGYDAIMKGLVPLGAAAGAFIPGIGPLVGGALGGLAAAGSQLYGNIGEGKIRAAGLDVSSKLNMWGGVADIASSALGVAVKAILFPLDLFSKALKVVVPSLAGFGAALAGMMFGGLSKMGQLGNPLSSLTQSSFGDYQGSQLMDAMSGMGSGTTSGAVQRMAASRQGFFGMGRFDTNQVINASMLGRFDMFYNNKAGNGYEDYSGMVTKLARQFNGQSDATKARSMYYLQDIDSTLATHVETLMQKYKVDKNTSMDWKSYNDPSTYGISYNKIDDSNREDFRTKNFAFQAMNQSIDIDKIRIAGKLWEKFGDGIMRWVQGLYKVMGQEGSSLKDILNYVGGGFSALWKTVIVPTFTEGFKGFIELMRTVGHGLAKAMPDIVNAILPAIKHVALAAFDIFWDLGDSLWKTFRDLLYNLSTVKIDAGGLMKALSGKGSFADAFSISPPASVQVEKSTANMGVGAKESRFAGMFYDKTAKEYGRMNYIVGEKGKFSRALLNTGGSFGYYQGESEGLKALLELEGSDQINGYKRANFRNPSVAAAMDTVFNQHKYAAMLDPSLSPGALFASMMVAMGKDKANMPGGINAVKEYAEITGQKDFSQFLQALGVGRDRDEVRNNLSKGIDSAMSAENVRNVTSGFLNAFDTVLNVVVTITDEGGKKIEKTLSDLLNTTGDKTVTAVVKSLEDLSKRVENLSKVELSRATQRAAAMRGAIR